MACQSGSQNFSTPTTVLKTITKVVDKMVDRKHGSSATGGRAVLINQ